MFTRITLSTALALGLMSAPAMAGDKSHSSGMSQDKSAMQNEQGAADMASLKGKFGTIDANGDGAISRDEWTSRDTDVETPANFFVLNTDEDDKVSKQEWNKYFEDKEAAKAGDKKDQSGQ